MKLQKSITLQIIISQLGYRGLVLLIITILFVYYTPFSNLPLLRSQIVEFRYRTISGFFFYILPVFTPFLFLSYIYSAKPFRLKARPFLDGMSNLLYIITPVILIGIDLYNKQGNLNQNFRFGVISARLRCIAMHCFSAIPDIEPDAKAGITTTAVYLGKTRSLWYCIMLYAVAGMLASQVIGVLGSLMGLVYCGVVALGFRYDIFRIYKRFPWINGLLGMTLCFFIYFVL